MALHRLDGLVIPKQKRRTMAYTLIDKIDILQEQLDRGFRDKWVADIALDVIDEYRRQLWQNDTQQYAPNNHHPFVVVENDGGSKSVYLS